MFISDDERSGNFTFQAEGSQDPQSPWFIGKLSHPSAESGVTIGAGYDMSERTSTVVQTDLMAAGCDVTLAGKLAKGAGLTGTPADKFVTDNLKTLVINNVQILRNLFGQIYPDYVDDAQSNYQFHAHTFAHAMPVYGQKYAGATFFGWEDLYPSIRVIAIDFVYQGFGRPTNGYGRPLHFCMANNFQWLIDYIVGTPALSRYESGRHRADYLRKNRMMEEQQYSQCAPTAR